MELADIVTLEGILEEPETYGDIFKVRVAEDARYIGFEVYGATVRVIKTTETPFWANNGGVYRLIDTGYTYIQISDCIPYNVEFRIQDE